MSTGPAVHFVAIGLLLAAAIVLAAVLKSAKAPGWPVLGGLLAGMLLGPTIFGRVMPNRYESLYVGGIVERQTRDDLAHEQERDLRVAVEAGASEAGIDRIRSEHEAAITKAERALDEARWSHQAPLRTFMTVVAALALLGVATRRVHVRDRRQGLIAPLTIGLWAALSPGGLAFACAWWIWPQPPGIALLAAAALAIGPWGLGPVDREAADRAEYGGAYMIQRAGRVASILALVAAAWAIHLTAGTSRMRWAIPLLALPAGWLLPSMRSSAIVHLLDDVLLPALAALVMIRIDVIGDANLWLIVAFMLLAGDGRWIAAYLGAMVMGGRTSLRTMRLVLGMMACGPTMLAVAAVGTHLHVLPESFAMAIALAAALVEITTPARRSMARRLVQAEHEIDEIRKSG